MKNIITNNLIFFFTGMAMLFSCANPMTPTGGPKDTVPPKVLSATPANKSIGVRPKKIQLAFNEYFVLDNPAQNISVSPPVEGQMQFVIKGKKLEIEFPDEATLKENTTYTLNFGAAIKDNNEGNIQDSFKYVFSTGPYLDSLMISGLIIDAQTNAPETEFLVGIYEVLNDSILKSSKPDYYTKTGKDGSFLLENLKAGEYYLVAFKDENFTYSRDLATEKLAFSAQKAVADTLFKAITIKSFTEELPTSITDVNDKNMGVIQFAFNKTIETFELIPMRIGGNLNNAIKALSPTNDTLSYYYTHSTNITDSFLAVVDGITIDTLSLNFKYNQIDSVKSKIPPLGFFTPLVSSSAKRQLPTNKPTGPKSHDFEQPFLIKFNRPILNVDTSKISINKDSTEEMLRFNVTQPNPTTLLFHVEQPLRPKTNYTLQFAEGALKDYYGLTNPEINVQFITTSKEDYGSITITIDSIENTKSYILEFKNDKDEIIAKEQISNRNSVNYKYKKLLPGTYKLIIIDDENQNGKWDTGNFSKQKQPENITIFPEKIEIRANWENEVVFKMKEKPKAKAKLDTPPSETED